MRTKQEQHDSVPGVKLGQNGGSKPSKYGDQYDGQQDGEHDRAETAEAVGEEKEHGLVSQRGEGWFQRNAKMQAGEGSRTCAAKAKLVTLVSQRPFQEGPLLHRC